jgi:hypothetical protein
MINQLVKKDVTNQKCYLSPNVKMFFKIIFWNLVIFSPKKREYCKRIFSFLFLHFDEILHPGKENRCAREKIKDSSLMKWYTFTRKCNDLTNAHCKQVLGSYMMFSKTKSVVPIFWKFKDKATCNSGGDNDH